MKIVATIQAVPERAALVAELEKILQHAAMPYFVSWDRIESHSLASATVNLRTILSWAWSQQPDWHLFLEDDQEVCDDFLAHVEQLAYIGQNKKIEAFYLANRNIEVQDEAEIEGYTMARITKCVAGLHGMLYRGRHINHWMTHASALSSAPSDQMFYMAIPPRSNRIEQVLWPVLAQHVGVKSTLHQYHENEHLKVHV